MSDLACETACLIASVLSDTFSATVIETSGMGESSLARITYCETYMVYVLPSYSTRTVEFSSSRGITVSSDAVNTRLNPTEKLYISALFSAMYLTISASSRFSAANTYPSGSDIPVITNVSPGCGSYFPRHGIISP